MSELESKLEQLRDERKTVREDVYRLGVRFNAGEKGVRPALDAAIRRSDELEAEIRRLTPRPPEVTGAEFEGMVLYGPPPIGLDKRRK